MFIKRFNLKDSIRNLEISDIDFTKLNVLVGTSGAGKTTIMTALFSITRIADGESSPADSWSIEFIDNDNKEIIWSGRFSGEIDLDKEDNDIAELIEEKIIIDGIVVLEKKDGKTTLNNNPLPVLDKYKSNVYLLREDDELMSIYQAMQSIIIVQNDSRAHVSEASIPIMSKKLPKKVGAFFKKNKDSSINDYCSIYNDLDCRSKIFFAKQYDKEKFDEFLFVYTSIFSNVDCINIKKYNGVKKQNGIQMQHGFHLNLKLNDGTIVEQEDISSGMFKTMMLLSDLMFSSKFTVLLIDEVENSLGVNCLPDIIQEIKSSDFQCIISTHHPKIINDIPPKNWLIVSREKGNISASKSTEIINSTSHHDKFIQLINSCIFRGEDQ
ncbi:hypothetical protein CTM93_19735 [Photobacterium phosphoreum]|uniref:AAA family ATPase n=1 Tax=Photobacterium phosphoreum TaxID=659 RepID=UPI000D17E8E5|nr:AAA family ATPase [Photobacterium phosphoreum]PSU75705.1 hypothetical protein CTM93_19735 [Photobacterium phosphoreum]